MNDPESRRLVKISVALKDPRAKRENLWAAEVEAGTLYEVMSVPYFAYGVNVHDIVWCAMVGNELQFIGVIQHSGWLTMRVAFEPEVDRVEMNAILSRLIQLGGFPDTAMPGFMSLGIPPDKDAHAFYEYLAELREARKVVFEFG